MKSGQGLLLLKLGANRVVARPASHNDRRGQRGLTVGSDQVAAGGLLVSLVIDGE